MRKQFSTYEIALALKELGFNEKCIAYFLNKERLIIQNEIDMSFMLQAPLYQQIIDWFREKYELIIDSPKPDIWNKGRWSVRIESMNETIILESIVDQPYWIIYRCYKSYEEAREQSILKVLKIIKEQNKNE